MGHLPLTELALVRSMFRTQAPLSNSRGRGGTVLRAGATIDQPVDDRRRRLSSSDVQRRWISRCEKRIRDRIRRGSIGAIHGRYWRENITLIFDRGEVARHILLSSRRCVQNCWRVERVAKAGRRCRGRRRRPEIRIKRRAAKAVMNDPRLVANRRKKREGPGLRDRSGSRGRRARQAAGFLKGNSPTPGFVRPMSSTSAFYEIGALERAANNGGPPLPAIIRRCSRRCRKPTPSRPASTAMTTRLCSVGSGPACKGQSGRWGRFRFVDPSGLTSHLEAR